MSLDKSEHITRTGASNHNKGSPHNRSIDSSNEDHDPNQNLTPPRKNSAVLESAGSFKGLALERIPNELVILNENINDDSEAQRKELERLLGTAKDENRKKVIQKAIIVHDNTPQKGSVQGMSPYLKSPSFTHPFPINTGSMDPSLRYNNRPTSAQIRRGSINPALFLDAIPEHRVLPFKKLDSNEIEIGLEQITSIFASCNDPRSPPHLLFENGAKYRSWFSTGLTPQFLCIEFYTSWRISKIELTGKHIEKLSLLLFSESLSPSPVTTAMGADTTGSITMTKKMDTFYYFNEITEETKINNNISNNTSNNNNSTKTNGSESWRTTGNGSAVRKIIFRIENATDPFFKILRISIKVSML